MALPMLESLRSVDAMAQVAAPTRFLAFFVPNGIHMPTWTPNSEGPLSASLTLQPVAHLSEQLLVLSGLDNIAAEPQGDGPGGHARGTSTFLTCTHPRKAATALYNGVSVDQRIAQQTNGQTRLPSLELGTESGANGGTCDSGYSCAYQRNISWASATQPAPKDTSPRAVFDRLFGGDDPRATEEQRARRRRQRRSVLDFVLDDAARLQTRLGAADKLKLDEYMTSVREVERRIEAEADAPLCESGDRPAGVPSDPEEHIKQMLDLMVIAMKCDITRVGTFMLGNGGSNRSFPFLGIHSSHHELSHHQDDPMKHQQLQTINAWEVEMLAYLLDRMAEVDEGGSSLLDNSVVLFGSEIRDGNRHDNRDVPLLLAGRGGGALDTGRHVRFAEGTPIADLFLTLMSLYGVDDETFGDDGTGRVDGLFS
jgi:hypothetical protein